MNQAPTKRRLENPLKNGFGQGGKYRIMTFKADPTLSPAERLKRYQEGLQSPIRVTNHENLIVLSQNYGLNLLLQQMGGVKTYPIEIDNAAIGTGTPTITSATTALAAPVLTGIIRSRATINVDNLVTEWFMSDNDLPNGTYREFGLKMGTQLFALSLISPSHTKGSNEDTLIEYTINAYNTH